MAQYENLPFPIGSTFGTTTATDGAHLEGREFWVDDINYGSTNTIKPARSYRTKKVRVVRNSSGQVLLGKRLVRIKAGTYGGQVDGYADKRAIKCFPTDEFLPAAGVAANDLFYVVVQGPAVVRTPAANRSVDITAGDAVVGITMAASTAAASTGNTDNGPDTVNLNVSLTTLGTELAGILGRALSTVVTNSTSADCLIDIGAL